MLGDVEIVDVEGPSSGCGVSGDAEALLEGVEQSGVDEDGEGGLLLSSKQQNTTCKCTHKERDFSCFPLLTNPLHVHLWKLATFPDCTFTWQKPSVFVEVGGPYTTYVLSFTL